MYIEFVRPVWPRKKNVSRMNWQLKEMIESLEFSPISFVSFESFALSKRVADCDALDTVECARARILLSIYIKLTSLIFIMLSSRGKIEITTPL